MEKNSLKLPGQGLVTSETEGREGSDGELGIQIIFTALLRDYSVSAVVHILL